jgi:hypothetical protein
LSPLAGDYRPVHLIGEGTAPLAPFQVILPGTLLHGRTMHRALGQVPDGLTEVDTFFTDLGHHHLSPVQLLILEGNRELRRADALPPNPDEHGQGFVLRFAFAPIRDSGSRNLVVALSQPAGTPDTAVTPFVTPIITRLPLPTDDPDVNFTLPLGLRFGPPQPLAAQAGAVLDRLSQYRPPPFKGPGVAVLLLAALSSTVLLLATIGLGGSRIGLSVEPNR